MCVVAGPGSGKTTVLVERFRWLVSAKGIPPDEIAAITFTEKAAANMLERLVAHSEPENRQAYQLARISTIHGFCARVLREHSLQAGLDPTFEVIDAWEAEIQLRRSIAAVLDRRCLTDPKSALTFLKTLLRFRRPRERDRTVERAQGDRWALQHDSRVGRKARIRQR